MTKSILIVDDEIQLLSLLSDVLKKEGYQVATARNGEEALYQARQTRPDLILLDVMMSKMDGYEFMQAHRLEFNTPIIMLTARVDEVDKLLGLQMGADDFITKPFSPREVVARISAVLRRTGALNRANELVRVGDLTLDHHTHMMTVADQAVDLTRSEFDLLSVLMAAPGRVFSRAELLDKIQGNVLDGYERTIDVHIKNIRKKIEFDPANPKYIKTVYGVGYRLQAA